MLFLVIVADIDATSSNAADTRMGAANEFLKLIHNHFHLLALAAEFFRRRCRLFGRRGVALGHLVHLLDRLVDLPDSLALLGVGRRDLGNERVHLRR